MVVFAFTLAAENLRYTQQKQYSDIGLNNGLRQVRSYIDQEKVVQCENSSGKSPLLSFHKIPKDKTLRRMDKTFED